MLERISHLSTPQAPQMVKAADVKTRFSLHGDSTITSNGCFSCLIAPFQCIFSIIGSILGWIKRLICCENQKSSDFVAEPGTIEQIPEKELERSFNKELKELISSRVTNEIFNGVRAPCDAVVVLQVKEHTFILNKEHLEEKDFSGFPTKVLQSVDENPSLKDMILKASTTLCLKVMIAEKKGENMKFSLFTEYRSEFDTEKVKGIKAQPVRKEVHRDDARETIGGYFDADQSGNTGREAASFCLPKKSEQQ